MSGTGSFVTSKKARYNRFPCFREWPKRLVLLGLVVQVRKGPQRDVSGIFRQALDDLLWAASRLCADRKTKIVSSPIVSCDLTR
jgi:hypothetical protein